MIIFHCSTKCPNTKEMIRIYFFICIFLCIESFQLTNSALPFHKEYQSSTIYTFNTFSDKLESAPSVDIVAKETIVAVTDSTTNTECPATTSSHCLKCSIAGCVKCPVLLVTDTRQCVEICPSGYIDRWSAHTEFMGRVCMPNVYSGPVMTTIAGLLGGFLVCASIVSMAVILLRRKRRRKSIKEILVAVDRSDFLRQLQEMRHNAEYFLAMLNDIRRQIRKLYLSGEVAAANAYRPVVRDLAKILILLNRPIELIPAPPQDWNRLYTWSEQALERYKPQVGQLIDFLQSPTGVHTRIGNNMDTRSIIYLKKQSIFRQNASMNLTSRGMGSINQKHHLFGSLISLQDLDEARSSDPFGSNFNNIISDLNASSLWLEDEFYKLGFRPQDEITTEL